MLCLTAQAILNSIAGAAAELFGSCGNGLFAFCQKHGLETSAAHSLQASALSSDSFSNDFGDFGFKGFGASGAYLMIQRRSAQRWGSCVYGTPKGISEFEKDAGGLVGSSSGDLSDFYRHLLDQGRTLLHQLCLLVGDRPTQAPTESPTDGFELDLFAPAMGAATPTGGVIGESIRNLIHKLGASFDDPDHVIRSGRYRLSPVLLET